MEPRKKLGFGLMRLPVLADGEIDLEQVKQMADLFLEQDMLIKLADSQKASGPVGTAVFSAYEGAKYRGISAAALLDSYNAAMVQPNPNFSVELNYLANELLKIGVTDTANPLPEEPVIVNGEDVTAKVREAWDFLIARCTI